MNKLQLKILKFLKKKIIYYKIFIFLDFFGQFLYRKNR